MASIRDFFLTTHMNPSINRTNLVLIPKVEHLTSINQFCPISLYNMVYKVILKNLAKKLKSLLSKIICPTHAAFVLGQSIHDCSVIIQKMIHVMKKKKGKVGVMAIKLDLKKAYHKLDWGFILKVLWGFGFH